MKKKTFIIPLACAAVLLAACAILGYLYASLDTRFRKLETEAFHLK